MPSVSLQSPTEREGNTILFRLVSNINYLKPVEIQTVVLLKQIFLTVKTVTK